MPAHFHLPPPFTVWVNLMYLAYRVPGDRKVMLLQMRFRGCEFAPDTEAPPADAADAACSDAAVPF